jgi:uncharacterized RDD family membrane protein YckC
MNTLLVFLPMIVVLSIGLLVTIPIIKKDRKQADLNQTEIRYSNFWLRLIAFIIDFMILSVIDYLIIIKTFNLEIKHTIYEFEFFSLYTHPIGILVGWLYYSILESSKIRATVGKMAFKIQVTDLKQNRISFWNATGRYFGKFISSFIFCFGFIMMFFMSKKQCLHDVLAGTIVTRR